MNECGGDKYDHGSGDLVLSRRTESLPLLFFAFSGGLEDLHRGTLSQGADCL